MALTRPNVPDLNQTVQNWQTYWNSAKGAILSTPFPPAQYATEGALPSVASYQGCIAMVENFAGTGEPVLAISDKAGWRFLPINNFAKANGNASDGKIDLLNPLMRVAEGFTIDFFLEPASIPGGVNAHIAMRVYDSTGTPALVTSSAYAMRGSARYGAGVVADWSHAAQDYAGIGYVGASNYFAASEEAFGTIKFTRGGSNSAWHYEVAMYYDVQGAPGTGAQRMFSGQGTLLIPGGLLLSGVRLYMRDNASGNVTGVLTTASRVRVTF